MKKTILLALTCLCTLVASAQSAFTIHANDTTYSFGIDSKITLTDDPLWVPDTVAVKPQYHSAFTSMRLNFESHFSTVLQQNTTGVDSISPSYLYADSIWAIDFTVKDYRRVVFSAYAEDSLNGVSQRIACKTEDFAQRCGSVLYDKYGLGYKMMYYGTNGRWTFLFNEKLMQFALIHSINGSPDLAMMKDTIYQKVDYSNVIDIDNVSDTWYADGVLNGTAQKLKFVLKDCRVEDRAMDHDGIAYSINTGRTKITYPIKFTEDDLYGYFPDEYDVVVRDSVPDFRIPYDNLIGSESTENLVITAGDTIHVDNPSGVSRQDNWAWPTLSILDGNRFQFDNGLVMCRWSNVGGGVEIEDYMKIPAGTILYRDGYYPTPAKVDTIIQVDTVYVEKVDTLVQKVALTASEITEILNAGNAVYSKIDEESAFLDLTEQQLSYYSLLYKLGKAADTADFSADTLRFYNTAIDNLRKAATCYTCLQQKLVNPKNMGKYLFLGNGSAVVGTLFQQKLVLGEATFQCARTGVYGSGYVAYAKTNVYKGDSTIFVANARGKDFVTATMAQQVSTFCGIDTIDAYVLYNPGIDAYIPVYVARNGGYLVEQWKGTTKNNYPTLEDAVAHLGPSSMVSTDGFWFEADYVEDESRYYVLNGATSLDKFYEEFTDYEVLATGEGNTAKNIFNVGVTINTATTPFTFTKDGETCSFSGVAFFKAKNSDGEPCLVALMLISGKYYSYYYLLNK